jgi:hypothetical protein
MAFHDPNLSAQIEHINLRLQTIENQLAILSQRAGVPFAGAFADDPPRTGGGVSFDPATGTVSFDPAPGAPPMGVPADPYADPRAGAIPPEVLMLARSGKKIQAIKLYRELTDADLKTAKKVIDGL